MSTIEERVAALESALASMTAAEKRIVELPAASSVANDDFVALDGVANGSRRFAASNLGGKAEVMTEAEWDDLPDSKLTDGKVYALSGVSPSTQDNPLWQKLGFASLDTQADNCSDAINELNTGLTNINSNLNNLFLLREYSFAYNAPAYTGIVITKTDLGITSISGYSICGIQFFATGANAIVPRTINYNAGNTVRLYNPTNAAISATLSMGILWVKSSFVGS